MRIIVTGGAGFIGSHLVDALLAKHHKVLVVDDLSHGRWNNVAAPQKTYFRSKLSILHPRLEQVFRRFRPEAVYHLAAQIDLRRSLQDPASDAQVNVSGSLKVFEQCARAKVKRLIFTSTGGAIYGPQAPCPTPETFLPDPTSPYGLAKLAAERYLGYYRAVRKLNATVLRFSNVYGPRQDPHGEAGVVAIFAANMLKNKLITINGSGKQTRDYVYVAEVARAALAALTKPIGTFNIATSRETSVNEVFTTLARLTRYQLKPKHVTAVAGEVNRSVLSPKLAQRILGWQAKVTFSEGAANVVDWLKQTR